MEYKLMRKPKKINYSTRVFNVPLTYEQCETIAFAMSLGRLKAIDTNRSDLDDKFGKAYLKFVDTYRKSYK